MTDFVRIFDATAWSVRISESRPAILVVMLGLLLLTLLQPAVGGVAKALFVGHLGLFIVWQPFVEGGQRLSMRALVLLALGLVAATVALDSRLLMLWVMLLAGIVGGKVLLSGATTTRWFYLLALVFLVLTLLFLATPAAFPEARLPSAIRNLIGFSLPLLLVVMAALPRRPEASHAAEVIDFINSVFVFLLLAVLVLGSLASMPLFKRDYAESLLNTLIVLGCVLLILGWAWNPHGAFGGIGEFFSRYLMSIGLPAEQWLQALADHTVREGDPERFVDLAVNDMAARLPWLQGLAWSTADGAGQRGESVGRLSEFTHLQVVLRLYSRFPLSPSMAWHFQLLTQLLGEFHADKQRARQLKELSYMQAVHETGARLTHDVKNLLQSLQTLCHAAEEETEVNSPEFRALLRRQLPAIASRLGQTLNKLNAPGKRPAHRGMAAADWWAAVQKQYAHADWVCFVADEIDPAVGLPEMLFSPVLENLLSNAEAKRPRETDLGAVVHLHARREGDVRLTVCDDGAAVAADIAHRLMRGPVASANGLGIGLYQMARLAAEADYRLMLAENHAGRVCFSLEPLQS